MIALDCASAEFYKDGVYDYTIFEGSNGKVRNSQEQADYLAELSKKYPIISIEDGMDENDWDALIQDFKNVVKEKFDISTSIDILPEKLEAYSSIGGSPHLDGE